MTSLNPVHTIGKQLIEAVMLHRDVTKRDARLRALELLKAVGIPRADSRIDDYPHQFSGGMRQRVMIAMALINEPDLLIADEPTTALDVTTQAQILSLMTSLQEEFDTAIIMITHDLGVVAEIADDVVVMYAGKVAEEGTVDEIFTRPHHPYTWGLLGSLPRLDADVDRLVQIQGSPPSLLNPPRGCRFHPRCPVRARRLRLGRARAAAGLELAAAPAGLPPRRGDEGPRGAEARDRHAGGGDVSEDLLVVEDLVKYFPVTRGIVFQKQIASVKAVDGISFTVKQGETLGVVGESGCGKSTMARCLMRLLDPTSGRITFAGRDITHLSRTDMRPIRRELMMIFQDPYASLNQRKRVGFIVAEALQVHKIGTPAEIKRRVQELLDIVGLNPEHYNRFPHEFSGGQRQRIGVARALAVNPKLIVCDEPVSALDVSVQAQILNLLKDLQRDLGLTYVFIAHDLNVVRHISDRVLVMYLGKVAEIADGSPLYAEPKHPYTGALLSAVPIPNPELGRLRRPIVLEGDVPNPINPPEACRFHPRCPRFRPGHCDVDEPQLRGFGDGHSAACHYPLERWPMTGDELNRADEEAVATG